MLLCAAASPVSSAQELLSVSANVAGMERYGDGRWGLVRAVCRNRSESEQEVTVVVTPKGRTGNQFIRTLNIPAQMSYIVSWPVHLDDGITDAFEFDYIVLKGGPDSSDILSSNTGEPTENFVSTNAGGQWRKRTNTQSSPGYCAVISSRTASRRDQSAVDRFAVLCREKAEVPPMLVSLRPKDMLGIPELLDAADQMIITASDLAMYPDVCDAIRVRIQRGARAVFILPLCGETTAQAILGDAIPVSVVDETTPLRVQLKHHPEVISAGHPDESHLREFIEPVTVVRCVIETGRTLWSVRNWPVLVENSFGNGQAFLCAVSPELFLHEVPGQGLDTFASRLLDQAFRAPVEEPLISTEALATASEAKIGYVIPGRGFAATLLATFTLLLGFLAWYFRQKDRAVYLLVAIPALALLGAVPGIIQGNLSRGVAPPTMLEGRIARVATGQSTFAADGVATLYHPEGASLKLSFEPHALLQPRPARPSGERKRFIWTDRTQAHIPNLHQPAGATSYIERSVVRTDAPMRALGRISADGLEIKIANAVELDPEDIFVASSGPDRMAVRRVSGKLWCTPADVLAPGQFSNATLLSAEQNMRANLCNQLFQNDERLARFPDTPSVLFWSTKLPTALHPDDDSMRRQSWTLFSLPLDLQPPKVGVPVTIPTALMPYHVVPDIDGSMSATYSRRLAKWIQKKAAAKTVLHFDLPSSCRPFEFENADVQLRIRAGSRTVKLQSGTLDQLKDILTVEDPVHTVSFTIPGEVLNLNRDSVLLRIAVGELKGVDNKLRAEQDNFWKIDRVLLTVRGKRVDSAISGEVTKE